MKILAALVVLFFTVVHGFMPTDKSRYSIFRIGDSRPLQYSANEGEWDPFPSSDPLPSSEKNNDYPVKSTRFAAGQDLEQIRENVNNLRETLQWTIALGDSERVSQLQEAIEVGENRDPECVYAKATKLLHQAKRGDSELQDKDAVIEKWSREANLARQHLPRFQLEGLFVGDYGGEEGRQLVNVTYSADTLIAKIVTGKESSRGKIAFNVNLALSKLTGREVLEPLELTSDEAIQKWGTNKLPRYPGEGRSTRSRGIKYVGGQLIMMKEDYFTFVWLPLHKSVLFTRPTPEETIYLLRDIYSKEDELGNMKDHLNRCFGMDMTTCIARQQHGKVEIEPFRRIRRKEELDAPKLEEEAGPESDSSHDTDALWNLFGALLEDKNEEK